MDPRPSGQHCSSARPNKFETLEILVWIGMHSADQPVLGIIPEIGMRSARRAASALKEKCPQRCVGIEWSGSVLNEIIIEETEVYTRNAASV